MFHDGYIRYKGRLGDICEGNAYSAYLFSQVYRESGFQNIFFSICTFISVYTIFVLPVWCINAHKTSIAQCSLHRFVVFILHFLHDLNFLILHFSAYWNRDMTRKIKHTRHIAIFKMYTSCMIISRLYGH